jgi:hypothetical protein
LRLVHPPCLKKTFFAAVLAGAFCMLTACTMSMLVSEDVSQPGLVYYLPKTIVTVKVTAYGNYRLKDGADPNSADPRDIQENIRLLQIDTVTTHDTADRSRSYSLKYDPSVTSLDRVCIGVSTGTPDPLTQGLLMTVEGASDDKTGDIIISVAKFAGRLAGPGAFSGLPSTQAGTYYAQMRSISVDIDPLIPRDIEQVNSAIRAAFGRAGRDYQFNIENFRQLMRDPAVPDTCPVNSVCYRTRTPVRFTLSKKGGVISSQYINVVNQRVVGHIDVSRAFMVEKITRLRFDNGVLAGVNIKKPSEGLAVAKLPLTVVDAVTTSALAAPGDFMSKFAANPSNTQLISTQASNASAINTLQGELQTLRQSDVLAPDNPGPAEATTFQLKCSGTSF